MFLLKKVHFCFPGEVHSYFPFAVERTNDKKGFIAEAAGPPKAGRRQRRRAEEPEGDDAGGWT
ncbi:hypothetical protein KJ633_05360, partial [bacterium]|nr:hypothetical protein [bacterium]